MNRREQFHTPQAEAPLEYPDYYRIQQVPVAFSDSAYWLAYLVVVVAAICICISVWQAILNEAGQWLCDLC